MNNIINNWKSKTPKYNAEFRDSLFEALTRKGGGSEKTKVDLGKHFSNNYELYIYAFFLGLYKNEYVPLTENDIKHDFNWPIEKWGATNATGRKNYTNIQEYIFSALIAKTEIDLIALEKGDITENEVVKLLLTTMEAYTNGGLILIKEKIDDSANSFLNPTSFLDLIKEEKANK